MINNKSWDCLVKFNKTLKPFKTESKNKIKRWQQQCQRKKPYQSKQIAERQVNVLCSSTNVVHSYLCDFCRSWHVGHPQK